MNRIFGMMPQSEVTITKHYKDQYDLSITIEAGPHGWTVMWADGGNTYKDEDNEDKVNFQHALDLVKSKCFELTEVKSQELAECTAHEDTLESKIEKWFEAGLSELGFHTTQVTRSQRNKCNIFSVEVLGSFPLDGPWFNNRTLLKLSTCLDTMVEMNYNGKLDVDGILECPNLIWVIPDHTDATVLRLLFVVKYVPRNPGCETVGVEV